MRFIFVAFFFFLSVGLAEAVDRFASPSGSGTTCSDAVPCTAATAISQALAGETVWLKSGVYTAALQTVRAGTSASPITIRSVTRHAAIVRPPSGAHIIRIMHSHTRVIGIVFDGNNVCCTDGVRVYPGDASTGVAAITNIQITDNRIINTDGNAILFSANVNNAKYLYNYLNRTAFLGNGEAFYMGSASGAGDLDSSEIAYNYIEDPTLDCFDVKRDGDNNNVHHNYCTGSGRLGTDGLPFSGMPGNVVVSVEGTTASGNDVHDNIIKLYRGRDYAGCYTAKDNGGSTGVTNKFRNNVCRDSLDGTTATSGAIGAASTTVGGIEITGNTFCNLVSYAIHANAGGANIHDNFGVPGSGRPSSECDTEEARILSEIASRPFLAVGAGIVAAATPTKINLTWTVAKFPPLVSVDSAKFSCTVAGFPRTITSATITSATTTELTLASAVLPGEVVICGATLGAVVNGGRLGHTWISNLADSAAFSNFQVTNGVTGIPPPPSAPPSPVPLRRFIEPECMYPDGPSGPIDPTCLSFRDENGNGIRDTVPPAAVFVAGSTGRYSVDADQGHFVRVEGLDFLNAVDATSRSASGVIVRKTGQHFTQGEVAYPYNVAAANYHLYVLHKTPVGSASIWVSNRLTNGPISNNANRAILPQANAFTWSRIQAAGVDAVYALNGPGAFKVKFESQVEVDCWALLPTSIDPVANPPTCVNDDPGTVLPPAYTMLKISGPTSTCAHLANATKLTFNGLNTSTEAEPTVKFLHGGGNRFYLCATIPDTDLLSADATDDTTSFTFEDAFEFPWRDNTNTTPRDATSFKFAVTAAGGKYDANYPANVATVAMELNPTCSITLSTNINGVADDTQWQIFCAFDSGFAITDGMQIRADFLIRDRDTIGTTQLRIHNALVSAGINDPAQRAVWVLSGTTVPGGADVTAPPVGVATISGIGQTSATISATVDEACTARAEVALASAPTTWSLLSPGVPSQSGIGTATITILSASTTYRGRITCVDAAGNRGGTAGTGTSFTTLSTSTADRFATHSGGSTTGNCTSVGTACTVQRMLEVIQSGEIGELDAGNLTSPAVYTGASGMIVPPAGKSGTQASPITVRCATPGACLINAGNAVNRAPVKLLSDNDWWVIDGINFANPGDGEGAVNIDNGSDHNVIKRFVAWNSDLLTAANPQPQGEQGGTIITHDSVGNTYEDCGVFGYMRKVLANSQGGNNHRTRRCWGVMNGAGVLNPKAVFEVSYGSVGGIHENNIGMWHILAPCLNDTDCDNQSEGIFTTGNMGNDKQDTHCADAKHLGSMAIVRSAFNVPVMNAMTLLARNTDCILIQDMVYYGESQSQVRALNLQAYDPDSNHQSPSVDLTCPPSPCDRQVRNVTVIGLTRDSSHEGSGAPQVDVTNMSPSSWLTTSHVNAAAGPSPFQTTAGTGSRNCFRYINGQLTSQKLWPWPMDAQIKAAIDYAFNQIPKQHPHDSTFYFGPTGTVTGLMESIWGTIPAGCKA